MAYEFLLPDLGEGVAEGEIATWLVSVGQRVAEDDPMVEVETDKATVDIPSPVDGVVAALHAETGERVAVGAPLLTIETGDGGGEGAPAAPAAAAAPAAPAAPVQATPAAPVQATPAAPVQATPGARRAARELEVELSAVAGSGPGGAVTEADVRAAGGAPARAEGRREPLRGVRRRIAERLAESHREVPKVTVVEECDVTELAARRGELSYVPFVVKAVVSGLRAFPDFNATLDGDDIVYLDRIAVGVAAQGPRGLVVPVLHDAADRTVEQLDAEVKRLAQAVRDDTVAPEQLRGGTFTVTLAGKLGGYFATPLVNPGEAAILGVHRIQQRPVVRDGEIAIREIGLVSCSFDHRITDGTRASMFLLHVIDELQRAR
ncbi:dihydrolipoamide acetyltransferase family protein [Conexibacter woesei]|uniref:Dihydrolipoamide acetyltransferase component of pyruvate dehydrogenase complex n=1 Tax=Conexibacter woesei (strain DSM 14684 / CCUG 47730 / CIP 108061 / JCM 11494 / NBRC 100937 / ID131577) TaxID=469383 RepID=D3F5F1_CONWI|nr:dihydrolipoamide acetyltransferase family protein [Conexibacter woesei]ADB50618.1 catalytic domain of components of various dehydrogenase complexes [Conexibacter woesei DSM 14684]